MKLQGDELRIFIERYADEITNDGIWKQKYLYIGKYIPEKKLKFAELSFAKLEEDEIPLLLYVGTLYGSKMDGLLLTTKNLHYRAILSIERKLKKNLFTTDEEIRAKNAEESLPDIGDQIVTRGSEGIPLSEIGDLSFKPGKIHLERSIIPGTILYLGSMLFSYFLNQCREDIDVLNDLFGRLSEIEPVETVPAPEPAPEPVPETLPKPVWAFESEELIWDASKFNIGCFFAREKWGHYNTFITNARIVRIYSGRRASGNHNQEKYFYTIELSDIRKRYTRDEFAGKFVLELQNGRVLNIYAEHAKKLFAKYLGNALERVIPVITFKDPDERFLFKEKEMPYSGAFCSKEFWETMFGGVRMNARFCVTNKRLLFYHADQVAGLSGGKVTNCSAAAPVFKFIWLPISGIDSISRERRGLSRITRLYIKSCAPVGCESQSSVIPMIGHQDDGVKYDPFIENIRGRAAVNFGKLARLSKEDRSKVIGILKSLLPHQRFEGIE